MDGKSTIGYEILSGGNMTRGTTPTLKFNIQGIEVSEINKAFVTIKQIDKVLTKTVDDIQFDNEKNILSLELSQEETLSFEDGMLEIQIRIITKAGKALATPVKKTTMEKVLLDEII